VTPRKRKNTPASNICCARKIGVRGVLEADARRTRRPASVDPPDRPQTVIGAYRGQRRDGGGPPPAVVSTSRRPRQADGLVARTAGLRVVLHVHRAADAHGGQDIQYPM
jgi:hypothetical protein